MPISLAEAAASFLRKRTTTGNGIAFSMRKNRRSMLTIIPKQGGNNIGRVTHIISASSILSLTFAHDDDAIASILSTPHAQYRRRPPALPAGSGPVL